MTNADKIRGLRNATLARVITDCCTYVHYIDAGCSLCPIAHICDGEFKSDTEWEKWLESEAEE